MRASRKRHLFYFLTLTIFVGGFIYWQSELTSDPPMYYSGLGQSLSTDPAQYIFHARNKILFGQSDPYDYPRWTVYEHSLTSLAGHIWFSIAGVSLRQANMVGVILSLGGLLFLILGLARHHRPWVTTVVTLCFVLNVTLFTYGRLSYLENGLIFLAALVFFVYSWWGDRIWGIALAGGLVSLAMLTGKLFGALLLPALILTAIFLGQNRRWKLVATAVASFAFVSVATILLLYGQDVQAASGYVAEQSYGLRGFPEGLSSPWGFIEYLISYGYKNHLYYLDIDILLFLFIGVFLLSWHLSRGGKISALSPAAVFSMFWMLIAIVGLMPLNYSPLRYALLIIPPVILFCFTMFDHCLGVKKNISAIPGRIEIILYIFIFWLVLFHTVANLFFFNTIPRPIRLLTWITLPGAIGLAYIARFLLVRNHISLNKRKLTIVLLVLLCFVVLFNGYQIKRHHVWEHNFNIVEANKDMEIILSPEAVVSGPYGPALTVNTRLKSFIHLFGVAQVDSTLFDRQPITHLAVDVSNWAKAVEDYPALKDLTPITRYWIRDIEVRVYNICKVVNNQLAHSYQETDFEKAVSLSYDKQYDQSLSLISNYYQSHPQSKSTGLLYGELLWNKGNYDKLFILLTSLANMYQTDFNLQLQCGRFIQILAEQKNDISFRAMAERYYAQAVKVNPFKADYARAMWLQIASQYGRGSRPGQP